MLSRPARRLLIRNARVWPAGAHLAAEAALADIPLTDVRLAAGLIAECAPGLRPEPGEDVMEAARGVLLPGLHDHHVHLRARRGAASVTARPPQTRTAAHLAARLGAADRSETPYQTPRNFRPTISIGHCLWVRSIVGG